MAPPSWKKAITPNAMATFPVHVSMFGVIQLGTSCLQRRSAFGCSTSR